MFQPRAIRSDLADPRPPSAVGHSVCFAGLVGVVAWIAVAKLYRLDGPYSALANLLA